MLLTTRLIGMSLFQIKCANYCLNWGSTGRIFLKGDSTGLSDEFQVKEEASLLEEQTVRFVVIILESTEQFMNSQGP